jgi:pectinesterase
MVRQPDLATHRTARRRHSGEIAAVLLCGAWTCAAAPAISVLPSRDLLNWRPFGQAASSVASTRPDTGERADIVVAQDGTGQFRTIQQALDSVSVDNARTRIILVKSGTYNEKIFVRSSHLALVGEDRDQTTIVFAELRKNWRTTHPDDWGAAVVNIADAVTDLFIGNLTVHNNYGSLHGDHDHQFAIRSGGIATRITLVHDRIVADGGDTLSLWNTGNGMYYHADCDFEGWVDYVCPRGWCYITDSRFFGRSLTASIWHDGSKDPNQKLVIRRSSFDGVPGFPLGRNNRDGQFFLLDNRFSANMADRSIYRPSAESAYRWPPRVYFAGNQRDGASFSWFADNLGQAEGHPRAADITPAWTFRGQWDPEVAMPAALPFASTPRPETGDGAVSPGTRELRWVGARNATKYRVRFGTATPPPFRAEVTATSYSAGRLAAGTSFYWRVDAVTPAGIVEGRVWSFRTADSASRDETADRTGAGTGRSGAGSTLMVGDSAPRGLARTGGASTAALPWRLRIVLVGDSTVTDEVGWGLGFKQHVQDSADCINLARNGRSSKSFIAEGLWTSALAARADYILIQFGHNDMPGKGPDRETDPATTYRANLARYVDDARAAGAVPVIVTSITRRRFGDEGRIRSDLGAYAEAAKAVAAGKGVPLVDLHAKSIELLDGLGPVAALEFDAVNADGSPDKTHLSPKGSTVFGAMVANELVRVVPALASYVK